MGKTNTTCPGCHELWAQHTWEDEDLRWAVRKQCMDKFIGLSLEQFQVGQKVEACWNGSDVWYPAVIIPLKDENVSNGWYRLRYTQVEHQQKSIEYDSLVKGKECYYPAFRIRVRTGTNDSSSLSSTDKRHQPTPGLRGEDLIKAATTFVSRVRNRNGPKDEVLWSYLKEQMHLTDADKKVVQDRCANVTGNFNTGDKVLITAGKFKGKEGTIITQFPQNYRKVKHRGKWGVEFDDGSRTAVTSGNLINSTKEPNVTSSRRLCNEYRHGDQDGYNIMYLGPYCIFIGLNLFLMSCLVVGIYSAYQIDNLKQRRQHKPIRS